MAGGLLSHNVLSWMLQTIVIACAAAPLPIVFRLRHPRMQLYYCHAVLAICLVLPLIQPWRTLSVNIGFVAAVATHGAWLFGILVAGVVLQLALMSGGLWRIRRYRIGATPLYPIPDAMRAAAEITHADALFCVSDEATGPMMLGWLAPVVLLPSSVLALDEEAQCGVACHELLHVRRGDWLVTLIEGFAGALLWFNPGVWLLLSEARLAREQLVDAESVRLTASREPYIDALLAIAREHVWPDLAAAPLFLRRSHLTQRMQLLLSDAPTSRPRLVGSACSIAGILACSIWFACLAFPMSEATGAGAAQPREVAIVAPPTAAVQQPEIAVPVARLPKQPVAIPFTDPYEPVVGAVEIPTADGSGAALSLLARAREIALTHARGTPPYRFNISFVAAGDVAETGPGEISETWMTGQKWRWTVSLGNVTHVRVMYRNSLYEDRHLAAIPTRTHMLRNEALWATRLVGPNMQVRTAKILWQGKSATCVLASETGSVHGDAATTQGRLWEEEEYCIDDASGELAIHSIAPGTYAQFEYGAQGRFHGLHIPSRIRIYMAGALVLDGSFQIADATAADEGSLIPAAGMTSEPRPVGLGVAFRTRIDSAGGRAVMVHAAIDGDGNVIDAEVSAATDVAGVPAALKLVRETNFGHTGTERQGYIEVQ